MRSAAERCPTPCSPTRRWSPFPTPRSTDCRWRSQRRRPTGESRTLRRRSPTDCPPRAHTESMTTRSTRSPRRRTVVALAVVLAVLAGFIVRLVDIQVVNAGEHIGDSMDRAFAGKQVLHGTRGEIVDQNGQTLAGSILRYDCQLDPLLIRQIDTQVLEGKSDQPLW